MEVNSEFLNLTNTMVSVKNLKIPCASMLQACCSLSVCPMYMCIQYVNMGVNSACLKLTNATLCVKITLKDKKQVYVPTVLLCKGHFCTV